MNTDTLPCTVPEKAFLDVLDNACSQLQKKQAEHSIAKLEKFDAILKELETELDTVCEKNFKRN